jgi:DNA-binding NarL/FixJ family response regulator
LIRVAIVEDDPDIRRALATLLDESEGFGCVGTHADCESALAALDAERPDVVLMDIVLPGMSGIQGTAEIRRRLPDADVVMLTVHPDDAYVYDALAAGAAGYLLKESKTERILEAIREVRRGGAPMSPAIARRVVESFRRAKESPLSARETEVLGLLCQGRSYGDAARALFVSEETIHFHIKNIYRKLEVHSKSAAVARAFRDRLV